MRNRILFWVVVLTVYFGFLAVVSARADDLAPTSACPTWSKTQMLCLHNWARAQYGVPPLHPEPLLYRTAASKADDIERSGNFSHDPLGLGWDSYLRVFWQGGSGWITWAENLVYGYPTIRTEFAGWLASPAHRAALLSPSYRLYGSAFRPFAPVPRLWVVNFAG